MDFLRIYLIGERGVGKSALVVRYLTKRFLIDCSQDTVEYEIEGKLSNGRNIHLKIYDIASEDLDTITLEATFPGITVFLLVFSITDRISFYQLKSLLQETNSARMAVGGKLALIGCKVDLDYLREVNRSTADLLARNIGATYHECSAKTGEGAFMAFDRLIQEFVLEKRTDPFVSPCFERRLPRASLSRAFRRAKNWMRRRPEQNDYL